MASFSTINWADVFPAGTVVGVYPAQNRVQANQEPAGGTVATGTVAADGRVSFTGLEDDTPYVAAALLDEDWFLRNFRTAPAVLGAPGGGVDDEALQDAVDALEELIAAKQSSADAATDTELASAVSALTTAISAKQDSSSAATDSELASAVSTLTTALNLRQLSSTAATDAELAAAIAGIEPALPEGGPGFLQRVDPDGVATWGQPEAYLPTGGPGVLTRSDADETPSWVSLPTIASLGNAVRVTPGVSGVVGNGSTDDTAAIQALIDTATTHDQPIIITPAINGGFYKTTARLDVSVNFGGRVIWFDGGAYIKRTDTMTADDDVLRICASDCTVYNANVRGNTSKQLGTGIKIGRPDADQPNGVWIVTPRCENLGVGVEFGVQTSGGSASTGDSVLWGGRIRNVKDGVLNRAFVNYVMGNPFISEVDRGIVQSTDRNSGRTVVQSATINQWSSAAIDFMRGRGNTVEEMWCEHTATQNAVPTEIVRVGSASYTAVNTNIGTLHLHPQFHNPGGVNDPSENTGEAELYALRLIRSRGLRCKHLEVTNELPQTAIVRVDAHAENVNNRFERISCGDELPADDADGGVWTHARLLSDANAEDQYAVTLLDVPGFAGDLGGTTLGGTVSAKHTHTVFRDPDEDLGRYWARRSDGGFVCAYEDSTDSTDYQSGFRKVMDDITGPNRSILLNGTLFKFLDAPLGNEPWADDQDYGNYVDCSEMLIEGCGMGVTRVVNRSNTGFVGNTGQASGDAEPFSYTNARKVKIRNLTVEGCGFAKGSTDAIDLDQGLFAEIENVEVLASRARALVIDGGDNGKAGGFCTVKNLKVQGRPYPVQLAAVTTGGTLTAQTYAYAIVDRVRDLAIGTPTGYTFSGSTATVTMASHGLRVGDTVAVVVAGAPGAVTSPWNKEAAVTVVPDANTFKIAGFSGDPGALPAGIKVITPANTQPSEPVEILHTGTTNKTTVSFGAGHYNVLGREVHRWDTTNGWRYLGYQAGNAAGTYTDTGSAGTQSSFTFQSSIQGTGVQCLGSSNNDIEAFIDGCGSTNVSSVGYGFDAVAKNEGDTDQQTSDNNVFRGRVRRSLRDGVRARLGSRNRFLCEINNVGSTTKAAGAKIDSASPTTSADNIVEGRIWEDVPSWQWYQRAGVSATGGSYLAMDTGVNVANANCSRSQIKADIRVKHTISTVNAVADSGTDTRVMGTGFNDAVRSLSATTTGNQGDRVILMDATAGTRTYTLPTGVSDFEIVVKKTDASGNAVTVSGSIDGASSVSLASQGSTARLLGRQGSWVRL